MRVRSDSRRIASRLSLIAVLTLLTPACATLRGSYPIEIGARAAADLDVGRVREAVPATYLRYFPGSITLRPGDAVRFQLQGAGEPHTVTLGTLVQSVADAIDAASPPPAARDLAELPRPIAQTSSGLRVNDAAIQPCVVEGAAPGDLVSRRDCARGEQPRFDGRQTYFSSGLLDASNDVFRMQLADSIRPGRYAFLCLVHPDVMRGTLNVVERDAHRPRPRAAMQRADDEEQETAESLAAGARAALATTPARAVAGLPAPEGIPAYLTTFGQETYRIRRGERVNWTVFGTHTITFGSPPDGASDGFTAERDDRVEVNRGLWTPVGSPGVPVDAQVRGAARRGDTIDVEATWDGTNRLHSGLLTSRNAGTLRYSVRFSRSGSYKYRCLVHPRMRGTVVVK